MEKRNVVFVAKSLDGYIADKSGGIEWLNMVPNPEHLDLGYNELIARTDAIVMGRVTFEMVCNFDCDWPYEKPVFVVSSNPDVVQEEYWDNAEHISGTPAGIVSAINSKGFTNLYIDGGNLIQSFLKEDLIDELIITTIPILLGEGIPLFGDLDYKLEFKLVKNNIYLGQLVQDVYARIR